MFTPTNDRLVRNARQARKALWEKKQADIKAANVARIHSIVKSTKEK
jgi:hypothetical protein